MLCAVGLISLPQDTTSDPEHCSTDFSHHRAAKECLLDIRSRHVVPNANESEELSHCVQCCATICRLVSNCDMADAT